MSVVDRILECQVSLDEILITSALSVRTPRKADLSAEIDAFHALARTMASQPDTLLQDLLQSAVRLCQAGSAGVSLLETTSDGNKEVFRWVCLAGLYKGHEGGTTPRDFSPCGTCLDRNSPQLYSDPARRFTYFDSLEPPIVEALVIPFGIEMPTLGTIWIVAHDESRKFDAEDVRIMTGLADLTAAALNICAVAKQNADLCQSLKAVDLRKDEFMATLAHELRNPLAPIRNALQIMRAKDALRTHLEWAGGVIDRQVQHMTRLVDDLLDISRIACNKLELRSQAATLAMIVQGAVEMSRPFIEQHGHELIITLPEESILLNADLNRLAQVFSNLLNNATKFTAHGGCIWLTAERQGSDAVVIVRDNGEGIAADMLTRIFELYKQVDHSIQRSEGGLGIGLALVKRLVEMHGGSIEARSDGPSQGSEFIVRLPIDLTAQQERREDRGPRAVVSGSNFRVLVVDDNRDAADSLAMMLRFTGNDPRTAYDGLAALEMADEFRPEVVLLDIGLPKLNGHEVARRIRQQPWGKQMILIALTGWAQDDDRHLSAVAGFDHHMVKPLGPAALMELLAELPHAFGKLQVIG